MLSRTRDRPSKIEMLNGKLFDEFEKSFSFMFQWEEKIPGKTVKYVIRIGLRTILDKHALASI